MDKKMVRIHDGIVGALIVVGTIASCVFPEIQTEKEKL